MNTLKKLVELIEKSYGYRMLAIIIAGCGVLSTLATIFIFFDWIPEYHVEWHRTNEIKPIVSLFPGQKIRLGMDFYEGFSRQDIASAKWDIKDESIHFSEDGLEPSFTLPIMKGGIYQLSVVATTGDKKTKEGKTNLYVVQDTPKEITLSTPAKIELTPSNNNFLKDIMSKGIEIYSGNGQWTKAGGVSFSDDKVILGLYPNEKISLYGNENKFLFRASGSSTKLTSYGSAQLPNSVERVKTQPQIMQ